MKKKIVVALISTCLVATLGGCFNIGQVLDGDGMVNEQNEDAEEGGQSGSDWDLSLMPNNNGNGEGSDNQGQSVEAVLNDTNNRYLLSVNGNGDLINSVYYGDIFDQNNGGVIGAKGDYVFYTQYLPNDYQYAEIHRYNFVTGEGELVASSAPSDYYNYFLGDDGNSLYHMGIDYNDEGNTVYSLDKYECKDGNWTMTDPGFSGFFIKASTDYDLIWLNGTYMTPCTMDGQILVREKDGNKYFFVDKDGNKVGDSIYLCESGSVVGMDDKYIVYNNYGDDYSRNDVMFYNVADGTSKTITTDGTQMKYVNGKFFYYVDKDKKVFNTYEVHMYDLASGQDKVLYTKTKSPYFLYSTPGIDFFDVVGNSVFYQDINDDGKLVWKSTDLNGQNPDKELLTVAENNIRNLGELEVLDIVEYCPECGAVDYTITDSYLVYDGDESNPEATAKINSTLKKEAEGFVQPDPQYSLQSECEYMHPDYVCSGQASTTDAWIINNKYLSIEINNYFYYGGAHGGSYLGSKVFDLSTGEEVDVMSLYSGTKEDMARVVAETVKADYNGPSQYGYFAEDADGVYQEAYDGIMNDIESIILTDNGVQVIFGEYSLGPYASGQFIYEFGYDQLPFNVQ